jgi:hypothetical protein
MSGAWDWALKEMQKEEIPKDDLSLVSCPHAERVFSLHRSSTQRVNPIPMPYTQRPWSWLEPWKKLIFFFLLSECWRSFQTFFKFPHFFLADLGKRVVSLFPGVLAQCAVHVCLLPI